MTYEDKAVTNVLRLAFYDEKPGERARDFIPQHRGKKRGRWFALAAASILLFMLATSLMIPAVARAIGDIPVLGESYTSFLTGTGMDIAYQSGLVNELNSSETKGDFTLTVIAAYADATQTVVMYQISSTDPDRLKSYWENPGMPEVNKVRGYLSGGGGSGSMQYIEEENIIFGMYHLPPPSWNPFGQKLKIEARALDISVVFPVQTIPTELNETVAVNESFEYEGVKFVIDSVTFSPSATQVSYRVTGDQLAPADKNWLWEMQNVAGTELTRLSGSLSNGKGILNFLPTNSPEVIILFKGYQSAHPASDTLLLERGSSAVTDAGTLTIGAVERTSNSTAITLVWSGEGKLTKPGVTLIDSKGYHGWVTQAESTEDGISLVLGHGELSGPVYLKFNTVLISVHKEIEVARVVRSK